MTTTSKIILERQRYIITTGKGHHAIHPRTLQTLPAGSQAVSKEEKTTFHLAPRVVLRVWGCKTELTLRT